MRCSIYNTILLRMTDFVTHIEKISFCLPASAHRDSWGSQRTLHTFANRTGQSTDQKLQKSTIFADTTVGYFIVNKQIKNIKPKT